MHTGPANANGARRRKLRATLLATSTHCALCGGTLNPDANYPADDATVIDEDVPRARGGNPLDRANTNAMHNLCNRWKSTMTLTEARALIAAGIPIGSQISRTQRKQVLNTNVGTWNPNATQW